MHSNLKITVDKRAKHPYGVKHRLQFFIRKAGCYSVIEEETATQLRLNVFKEHHGKN